MTIAANIAVSILMLPGQLSRRDLSASKLADLGWAYGEGSKNGRVVCVLFYDAYRAPELLITADAYHYLDLEERIFYSHCRVKSVTIVHPDEVRQDIPDMANALDTVQFGRAEDVRSARLLRAHGTVRRVIGVLDEGGITFIPIMEGDAP